MYRTKTQNRRMYQLFAKLNIDEDTKLSLVSQFTNDRTSKSSLMLYNECNNLIKTLEDKDYKRVNTQIFDKKLQELRRKIFKIMYDIAFISNTDTTERKMYVINEFLKRKSKINKHLNDLTVEELDKVITQLYAIRRVYKDKEKTESTWN